MQPFLLHLDMRILILLILIIMIIGWFKPTTNVLIGKWELFYLRTVNEGGTIVNGKDTTSTTGFSEQTLKHGGSLIIEFKEDSSYIADDFRTYSTGVINKTKYTLVESDKVCIYNDTLLYTIIKDTLTLRIIRFRNLYKNGKPLFLMKYLRQK